MALMPLAAAAAAAKASPTPRATNKRPVGPVMRLLQEGRSRRNKATVITQAAKSTTAANTTGTAPGEVPLGGGVADKPQQQQQHAEQGDAAAAAAAVSTGKGDNDGNNKAGIFLVKNRTSSALAKKLHARVKSEKELKVDPKKRVKAWLRGVELDLAPIPLDGQGFPIYR
jgi:hypothetical protein